jgi:3-phenylpropionate/trans-cinnamate dioxygenase ferredoxin reductase subunit
MYEFKYLIVGGGMAADAAVQGIRSLDSSGSIAVVSAETEKPYDRPPLSKGLWSGKALESIWRKTDELNAKLFLGRTISFIEPEKKLATDSQGKQFKWEKLLLATGGSPRRLPFADDQVIYFRTVADYRRLRAISESKKRIAVIGAGFIGSEIAAALAKNGNEVTMIFPRQGIVNNVFPKELSQYVSRIYQEKGVQLLAGTKVEGLERRGDDLVLKTNPKHDITISAVVAGIGIEPNVELARSAGLVVENGVDVDPFLRTSHADIYAAGDVAAFFNPALGKRIRVEHEDNANTTGRVAGQNMAGSSERYTHLPMFYSDLFEFGYEAVGEVDSRLQTVADWKNPNKEGVIYYLENGRVRGVLLWNVWGQVDAARALIADPGPFHAENVKGRLK